jgi:hypothetical protein
MKWRALCALAVQLAHAVGKRLPLCVMSGRSVSQDSSRRYGWLWVQPFVHLTAISLGRSRLLAWDMLLKSKWGWGWGWGVVFWVWDKCCIVAASPSASCGVCKTRAANSAYSPANILCTVYCMTRALYGALRFIFKA